VYRVEQVLIVFNLELPRTEAVKYNSLLFRSSVPVRVRADSRIARLSALPP